MYSFAERAITQYPPFNFDGQPFAWETVWERQGEPEAGASILVVDDEPGLRLLMTAILEREGYRVQLAENGAMALERLSKAPLPHLIVLDLEMPEVNGVAFRTIQLQSTELARIPVVVCTSEDATRYREQFLGCPRVTKPFRIEAFVAAVRSALHRKLA